MKLSRAPLEDWMRDFYFSTTLDLGSSGVECWSVAELRELLDIAPEDIDRIAFTDSESYGSPALRDAIARRFADGDGDRVMVTHGSTEAIFLVMNALLEPGDEIVVISPGYHSLGSVAASIGCRIKSWELRPDEDFHPDLDELSALISPRTTMVVVNFPHNPTGVSLSRPEFDRLVDIAARSGAYLVWDGAFTELVYSTEPLPEPSLRYERCVSVGTMSKAYGLPGTRVGWCLGSPEVLAEFISLRDALTICLSPLSEFFAERALTHAGRLLGIRRAQAAHNLDLLAAWSAANEHLVDWLPPTGGCTAFPRIAGCPDTDEMCRRLGRDHSVLLVPGSCFAHPDRVRLGFGGATADLETGLRRLRTVLEQDLVTAGHSRKEKSW